VADQVFGLTQRQIDRIAKAVTRGEREPLSSRPQRRRNGVSLGTPFIRGKLDAELAEGSSATMSQWHWNGSAEADTTINHTVYDWLLASGQTIPLGAKVVCIQFEGRYYVIAAECDA
jgi:hypothetical protein